MEPTDLTVRVLQEIREEIRGMRSEQRESAARLDSRLDTFARETTARFEVIETTLRDLAQQLVILARGVKTAIEARANVDHRLDEHERRIADLEKRASS